MYLWDDPRILTNFRSTHPRLLRHVTPACCSFCYCLFYLFNFRAYVNCCLLMTGVSQAGWSVRLWASQTWIQSSVIRRNGRSVQAGLFWLTDTCKCPVWLNLFVVYIKYNYTIMLHHLRTHALTNHVFIVTLLSAFQGFWCVNYWWHLHTGLWFNSWSLTFSTWLTHECQISNSWFKTFCLILLSPK